MPQAQVPSDIRVFSAVMRVALIALSVSWSPRVNAYSPQRDTLTIDFYAPPVSAQLVDSAGRRCGVDFSRSISSVGIGTQVQEMEHAMVFGFNLENDDPDSPGFQESQHRTNWQCSVFDGDETEYDLRLRGMGSGSQSTIEVSISRKVPGSLPPESSLLIPVMIGAGDELVIRIVINSTTGSIEAVRTCTPGQLKSQVELGCRLGLIAPGGFCNSLLAKANEITGFSAKGHAQAYRGKIRSFLNELSAQGGKKISEPALTILREEAEALLNPLRPMRKRPSTVRDRAGSKATQ